MEFNSKQIEILQSSSRLVPLYDCSLNGGRSMNSISNKAKPAYKECACSSCAKNGFNHLRIVFLHKHGWFCDSCANSPTLTRLGLIDEEGIESA